jgi:hypothetical protein
MANMGYCRFRNTLEGVQDCVSALKCYSELSESEYAAMQEMIEALEELKELSQDAYTAGDADE